MTTWEAVAERGAEATLANGSILMRYGERTRHCYAIRSGEVMVTVTSRQGATLVLARRGPGSIIGLQSALDGEPRSATVTAATEVVAVVLGADELERLLRDRPDIALAELRRVSAQLREMTERFALQAEDLRSRILGVLETHVRETGDSVFRSTREEFAGWVGATREAVVRALRELDDDGVVALERGAIRLVRIRRRHPTT